MFQNQDKALGWLGGIIDGEGSVSNRGFGDGRGTIREIRITNTDLGLLTAVEEVLRSMGIRYSRYDRSERERLGNKPIFDIVITGTENLETVVRDVPLMTIKGEKLAQALQGYVRGRGPSAEELRVLVSEGLSDEKIAARYGYSAGAAWAWRKKHGITR